ncbi:MAG: methionyl-tRNA formyltransferase [Phycisphaerae bacterium]
MRVIFLGTGAFGEPALEALLAAGHEVVGVVSQPDRAAGRGLATRPTPIHVAADRLRLRHVQTADANALDLVGEFGGADVGVVVAFGQKLGPALLASLPRGCVNLHGSLLPKYRGAAPIQWAILSGEATTGVTVFQITAGWDAGPIWATRETPIGATETADELHDRLAVLGGELMIDALARIAAGESPTPQDAARATRAPKLSRADRVVDWAQPARAVVRRIHGLWSWPCATGVLVTGGGRRETVQLARACVVEAAHCDERAPQVDADPPTVGRPSDSGRIAPGAFAADLSVETGAGRVRLMEVKPAGGKLMSFAAYANGRRIAAGDRLESPDESA